MPYRMIPLLIILLAAVALLLANRLRPDVIALGVALALGLTGVVTPEESLSGFRGSVTCRRGVEPGTPPPT